MGHSTFKKVKSALWRPTADVNSSFQNETIELRVDVALVEREPPLLSEGP